MEIHVTFKNTDPSESLKDFITTQCSALKKYFDGKISINWVISHEKLNRIAHCHLVGNHMDYFGEGVTQDYKASIDLAFDKIEKQIRKHKEIVKDHLHHRQKQPVSSDSE